MRVGQIIDGMGPGGAQKLLVQLVQQALEHGIEMVVVTLAHARSSAVDELERLGVRLVEFPSRRLFSPARLWRLARFVRNERFDVVQCHLTYANILGPLAGRLAGVPVVATLRSTSQHQTRAVRLRGHLEHLVLDRLACQVVAVGPAVARAHQPYLRSRRITVIVRPTPLPACLDDRERAGLRAGLVGDPARPIVVAVGRLSPEKGYDDLLAAFLTVHRRHPAAALIIAGSGDPHELAGRIGAGGLEKDVKLLGDRRDVPRLLAASDLFVMASHWEGLPSAVGEAMAAGLPVVATAVGDVPWLLGDAAGLLVPPHQPEALAAALIELLDDPPRRAAMGQAARSLVAGLHSPAAWFDDHLAVYRRAMGARAEAAP